MGRIQTLTYPSGDSISYHYDAAGRIASVDGMVNGASVILASNISYAPFGPVTAMTYGNGAVLSQSVDSAYRISAQSVPGIYAHTNAQHDPNGNLTAFSDVIPGSSNSYSYDALNRLTAANGDFGPQALGYDKNGNRLSWTTGTGTSNYSYETASNRLSAVDTTAVTLDANGNSTSDGRHGYTYNTHNQLVSVDGTITYAYNALGQRVTKTTAAGTASYVYGTQGQLLAESANGSLAAEYVYLNGAPLAVIKQGNVYYIHTDHLGTPRAVSDQNQKLVWMWNSDPFGTTAANEDPDGDGTTFTLNLRFPGQYYDAETGFDYNYYRYYDPSTGRYITSDPIGLRGGRNTYGYVSSNPLNNIDPFGLMDCNKMSMDLGVAPLECYGMHPGSMPKPENLKPIAPDPNSLELTAKQLSLNAHKCPNGVIWYDVQGIMPWEKTFAGTDLKLDDGASGTYGREWARTCDVKCPNGETKQLNPISNSKVYQSLDDKVDGMSAYLKEMHDQECSWSKDALVGAACK